MSGYTTAWSQPLRLHHIEKEETVAPKQPVQPFRAIIFDLDGTLVDSEPAYMACDRIFLERYGITLEHAHGPGMVGIGAHTFFRMLEDHAPDHPLNAMPLEERINRKHAIFLEIARHGLRAFPGVVSLARLARQAGLPIAIASGSTPEAIEESLELTGLRDLFRLKVSAAEVPHGKPSPDVFIETARRLGLHPAECLVLEDSIPGVEAAKSAGMTCVALPDPSHGILTAAFDRADLVLPGGARDFLPGQLPINWRFDPPLAYDLDSVQPSE